MTAGRFVVRVVEQLPEAGGLVAEHLDDNDGVLLHLLVGDLRRFAFDAWKRDDGSLLQRCLGLLEQALVTGDDRVDNAVSLSFVEDSSWWEPQVQPFIATWPPALTAEVERRRASRPGG